MFETTMINQLEYHHDKNQILKTEIIKKINFWYLIDCEEIRAIDGFLDGDIHLLAIGKYGEFFKSAGEDK